MWGRKLPIEQLAKGEKAVAEKPLSKSMVGE